MELIWRELKRRESVVIRQMVGLAEGWEIVPVPDRMGHMFRIGAILDCYAIDVQRVPLRFNRVPSNGDDPFDKILGAFVRGNEYKYISSCRFMEVKEFNFRSRNIDAIDKFADKDAITNKARFLPWNRTEF